MRGQNKRYLIFEPYDVLLAARELVEYFMEAHGIGLCAIDYRISTDPDITLCWETGFISHADFQRINQKFNCFEVRYY